MALVNELKSQGDFLFRYRGTLPLVILIPALVVYLMHAYNQGLTEHPWESTIWYVALATSLLGLAIRCHVIGHVAPDTSGRNTEVGQKASVVNSTGMYSLVRHPLYVGNFFMWLGPALLTMNFWFIAFFIVLFYLYYERIMYAEERYMEGKFGDTYMNWAAERPAFTPRFNGYTKATTPFNWRKVLSQERSGFLATFLIFWLFDVLGRVVNGQGLEALQWNFWAIAFICALVIFLILKAMKRSAFLRTRPA